MRSSMVPTPAEGVNLLVVTPEEAGQVRLGCRKRIDRVGIVHSPIYSWWY
jgi:hypothetical protein